MLAVGEYLLGPLDDRTVRMTSGLAGGVGGTHEEVCGALSGGALLIGALHGRTGPGEDDTRCRQLVTVFRQRFADALGTTRCGDLQARGYGSKGTIPCAVLAERAAVILLEVLDGINSTS